MIIFYGGAIQGNRDRKARSYVHQGLIETVKSVGCSVVSEHASGVDHIETAELLEVALGPLPPKGLTRTQYIRGKMIEAVEGNINAALFEVSTPSLGTGIEIAHAYLRPRLGLKEIPILALYERDYWPNQLSSMIGGITAEDLPSFRIEEYTDLEEARTRVLNFLGPLGTQKG